MSTIGSFVCVRNGFDLDYSFEVATASLLKVCDQLILCDSDSSDGTRQAMDRMADKDSRITVINWPWPAPNGESHHWFLRWLRFSQSHLTTDMVLYLDADEVLDDSPECHQAIRESAEARKCIAVDRLNYWSNPHSLIPDGECCGKWCVRMGPREYPVVSDEPNHAGEQPMVDNAVRDGRIKIHHLGFLRERESFYRKARVVLSSWFGRFDPRLEVGEQQGKQLWETECEFTNRLEQFYGYQPDAVQRWLSDRGHDTEKYLGMQSCDDHPVPMAGVSDDGALSVLHSGDLGDIIHGMSVFRIMGRVRLFYRDTNWICKRIVERIHLIRALLESQPYIESVQEHKGELIHWNASDFRQYHSITTSLSRAHLLHYRGQKHLPIINPDFTNPWLTGIIPDERGRGRIIINRTGRYQNPSFRWADIVQHYGQTLMFVGTKDEHAAFCAQFGSVQYHLTADLMEVARLIAASDAFMGNQSACLAVAEGMKHRRVVEVCQHQPDVIVAMDENLHLSADGSLDLPPLAGKPALKLVGSMGKPNYNIQTSLAPKTGWHCRRVSRPTFDTLHRTLMRDLKMTSTDAKRAILDDLCAREPSYFGGARQETFLMHFREAVANAS